MPHLDNFTRAYVECLLWTETDEGEEPLDETYTIDDIAEETLARMKIDCAAFQSYCADLLKQAVACTTADHIYTMGSAGHDFALTRNGHGVGFWDRGLGDIGEKLSKACEPYGTYNLYVGDDGLIYGDRA